MAISEVLKKAIVLMPGKEKDKLLLRLINKDSILIQRLEFELIEHGDTVQQRRDEIKQRIARVAARTHDTPGWMMMDMRSFNGEITQHVKVTKDKYGEIELTLYLFLTFFEYQSAMLLIHNSRSDSCAEYIAKRVDSLVKKLNKFNPDYYVDFERDMQKLLDYVHSHCSRSYARELGIVKSWP
ncbi:MAG: hypothetical protein U0X91_10830 [Spirosomataceae bacterium]